MAANDITASNVSNVSGSSAQTTGRNHDVWGAREVGLYRVTGTNGYVTGGFTFDPKTYGFQGVPAAVFISARNDGTNFLWRWEYNPTTKKIFGIVVTTGVQIASAVDVSTAILDIIVVGE